MGWASHAINKLREGQSVTIKPFGQSMKGRVESGSTVIISPVNDYNVGDIVLCRVRGKEYLHLIVAKQGTRFQIGNNRGHINGWVGPNCIFGRATQITPP